jgi:hypothetical protein
MVFTQIWYLHKQALQDQNKGFTNSAEITRFDGCKLTMWTVSATVLWFRVSLNLLILQSRCFLKTCVHFWNGLFSVNINDRQSLFPDKLGRNILFWDWTSRLKEVKKIPYRTVKAELKILTNDQWGKRWFESGFKLVKLKFSNKSVELSHFFLGTQC